MKNFVFIVLLISTFTCGCTRKISEEKSLSSNTAVQVSSQLILQTQEERSEKGYEYKIPAKHPIDITEEECISKVFSTYDISQCSYKAAESWFKEIEKYLNLLQTITPKEDYLNILQAQEDWEKYRKSEFVTINAVADKQGTMFQNVAAGLKTNVIKVRALELKELYDTLIYE